ncbi:MAG: hypothetical protein HYX67_15905 [Candidatus Melainabacteria bacterium]|nr:hypothetical protein [Candidatus Melainabacteria bacterium]
MFQRATKYCMLFLGIVTLLWGFSLVFVRPSDLAVMKKCLKEQEQTSSQTLFSTTQQQRKGVVKEIWFAQEDNTRLNYRIHSESSLLTIKPDGKNFELIEKLEKIKCWMQDKLYEPGGNVGEMQQVRFLAAEEGLYRYTTQEFLAQSVALSLFRMGGHELPKEVSGAKPFLKGIAEDVSFAVSGKNPQFKAKHFKAELNNLEDKK